MRNPAVLAWSAVLSLGSAGALGAQSIALEPIVESGLGFPVAVAFPGDASGRLFVALHPGVVRVHDGARLRPQPFLDITRLVRWAPDVVEEGLLALAFHPSYPTNGLFYVYYTNNDGDDVLVRYRVSADPNVADPDSAEVLLTVAHPTYATHNGGQIQFGPDGSLYLSVGDGGGDGDPGENAQNLGVLLGKVLRLDVDSAAPYAIPPDNPFVGVPGARPEIWSYGLRHPWRFSIDRLSGDLFIGDVSRSRAEEVDFEPAGAGGRNYGWDDMEGSLCYEPPSGCLAADRVLPILEYDHSLGDCAIVGGYRYRGTRIVGLGGKYLYGDYCSGQVRMATERPGRLWTAVPIPHGRPPFPTSTFGEDDDGELYLARYAPDGGVYRIVQGPMEPLTRLELEHGGVLTADLSGGEADLYRFAQAPFASYEVVLDGVSGDVAPGLRLSRLAPDAATVLQESVTVGTGPARALRWRTVTAGAAAGEYLRVGSPACGSACGPDDVYRLRAWETTAFIPRFSTADGQSTALVLQAVGAPVAGRISFWGPQGEALGHRDFSLAARASLVLEVANVPGLTDRSGSVAIAHDGGYGALAGKAVVVDRASGFAFDAPLSYRPR